MSELLIGIVIGFLICWGVVYGTEAVFEKRHARSEPEAHS